MSSHQATEQMIGYLYQVRYALYLLLNNDDDSQISIEKFDDVAFINDEDEKKMIQLKHHINGLGDLSNSSTDLWRTINVWADLILKDKSWLDNTKFIIITTAKAPKEAASYYLMSKDFNNNRNIELAFEILRKVAETSKNKKHIKYYENFLALGDDLGKKLISCIYVIDGSSNIVDVEKDIKKMIRYCTLPKYEDIICNRLEGWWYKKSIEYLLSDSPIFINQNQLRSKIVEISYQYKEDNLPIDVDIIDYIDESDLSNDDRLFYEQLRLISLSNERINIAIRDYYRAFKQRANWVRDGVLFINELDEYEEKLVDEWNRIFLIMKEDLEDLEEDVTEKIKIRKAKQLYNNIQGKDFRIRERCSEAFIMRGSYHMLSNKAKIGWHIDFKERLKEILYKLGE